MRTRVPPSGGPLVQPRWNGTRSPTTSHTNAKHGAVEHRHKIAPSNQRQESNTSLVGDSEPPRIPQMKSPDAFELHEARMMLRTATPTSSTSSDVFQLFLSSPSQWAASQRNSNDMSVERVTALTASVIPDHDLLVMSSSSLDEGIEVELHELHLRLRATREFLREADVSRQSVSNLLSRYHRGGMMTVPPATSNHHQSQRTPKASSTYATSTMTRRPFAAPDADTVPPRTTSDIPIAISDELSAWTPPLLTVEFPEERQKIVKMAQDNQRPSNAESRDRSRSDSTLLDPENSVPASNASTRGPSVTSARNSRRVDAAPRPRASAPAPEPKAKHPLTSHRDAAGVRDTRGLPFHAPSYAKSILQRGQREGTGGVDESQGRQRAPLLVSPAKDDVGDDCDNAPSYMDGSPQRAASPPRPTAPPSRDPHRNRNEEVARRRDDEAPNADVVPPNAQDGRPSSSAMLPAPPASLPSQQPVEIHGGTPHIPSVVTRTTNASFVTSAVSKGSDDWIETLNFYDSGRVLHHSDLDRGDFESPNPLRGGAVDTMMAAMLQR